MTLWRTGIRATNAVVTVRALSVSQYRGTPPKARIARSRHATRVSRRRLRVGITTRNRDQASQLQNR